MMGSSDTPQKPFFYAFNLDDVVPQDHLLRSIDRFLDLSDLRQHLEPYYSHTGRPSVRGQTEPGLSLVLPFEH
jgi:transposase